jgi:3-methylcrotonyl-CoA carboxylase alpha subunit
MRIDRTYGWGWGDVTIEASREGRDLLLRVDGAEHTFTIDEPEACVQFLRSESGTDSIAAVHRDGKIWIHHLGQTYCLEARSQKRQSAGPAAGRLGPIEAPMTGTVRRVLTAKGESVAQGEPLVVLEAMKMELSVRAPAAGRVGSVMAGEGERVEQGSVLLVLLPLTEDGA